MRAKIAFFSALALAWQCLSPAGAQEPVLQETIIPAQQGEENLPPPTILGLPPGAEGTRPPGAPLSVIVGPPEVVATTPGTLSNWITYNRGCCLGPLGNNVPLSSELFLRNGVCIPTGATIVGRNLQTGWDITGGGRILLFNPAQTRAWTVEASITNMYNYSNQTNTAFPLSVFDAGVLFNFGSRGLPGVTIRDVNRTFFNFGGGRQWYLLGAANAPGRRWRIGIDGGGRWGSEKMDLNQFHHRTDTIGGVYAAVHSDVEFPCGCAAFFGGIRSEWDYTWSDILQTVSDIMSINVLLTAGVRF